MFPTEKVQWVLGGRFARKLEIILWVLVNAVTGRGRRGPVSPIDGSENRAMGREEPMFRRWKIVALVFVAGLTGSLFYLFLVGKLLRVAVRVVEVIGRLGRR
jgi:hypothetical protein